MKLYITKIIFFAWTVVCRNVKIIKEEKNELFVVIENSKENNSKYILEKSNKIKNIFLINKYIPTFLLIFLIIPLEEFETLDLSILFAPFLVLIYNLFKEYKKVILLSMGTFMVVFFIYYNVLLFPIFIKYCLISYVIFELIFDLFFREHYKLYEKKDNKKRLVAFASKREGE